LQVAEVQALTIVQPGAALVELVVVAVVPLITRAQ
jgi:hypothetical protein